MSEGDEVSGKLQFAFIDGSEIVSRFSGDDDNPFARIKYLHVTEAPKEQHFICYTEQDKLVGSLALQQSPWNSAILWVKHVSVDRDFQNRGIAKQLLAMTFEHALSVDKVLEFSSFSNEGKRFLKPAVLRLQDEFPTLQVKLTDKSDEDDFSLHPGP